MPTTFYNDHYDFLIEQDYLFARKISPRAHELTARLGELYSSEQTDFKVSMQGKSLYQFLTQRGRLGQRYVRRFWETEGSIERDRMLYLVVCKKWPVAKRFVSQFGPHINGPLLEYIFNETDENIPDLGGYYRVKRKNRAIAGPSFGCFLNIIRQIDYFSASTRVILTYCRIFVSILLLRASFKSFASWMMIIFWVMPNV